MPLEAVEAEQLAWDLAVVWRDNRQKSLEWQSWAMGKQKLPVIPDSATAEYRALQEEAVTPWLALIVQSLAQALIVDGYRSAGASEDNLLWNVWQSNNMDAKQVGIYEASFTTGIAYNAVLPASADRMPPTRTVPMVDGVPVPEWRPYSSSVMSAFFESPYDDWPVYALAGEPEPRWRQQIGEPRTERWRLTMLDDEAVYLLTMEDGGRPALVETREHNMGVCPVVAYVNRQTITGRVLGEVEPYTAVAARIDQDVFDRLVVQRFGSWRVRTATGLVTPDTPEGQSKQELDLKVGDILVSDSPDTQFSSLPGTELTGHLRAPVEDVRVLSAVSQTPPTHLTGDLANISADALAAIEAAYNRKVTQRKETFAEAHEKSFALSAQLLGVDVDPAAEVRWADLESRSLAQQADAFGKLAQMLEIPVEVLWDKIGFLTDQDRARARELRAQGDGFGDLIRELSNAQTPAASDGTAVVPVG